MVDRSKRIRTLAGALVWEIRAENVPFMAGSIAYHAFVSLLPMLLLLLTAASLVGDRSLEQSIVVLAETFLSQGAGSALVDELRTARQSAGISILGGLVLLWGTLRIFRGLDVAFSDIYETEAENTLPDRFADGMLVLVTFGLAVVVGGVVQANLGTSGFGPLGWVVNNAVGVLGLSVAFLPMYYVFPDADVTLVEVLPGTVFAAAGVTALKSLFGLYVFFGSQSANANAVAGVIVLLTWLYLGGLVILVGAVINAVLSNRSRDVSVRPVLGDAHPVGGPVSQSRTELVDGVDGLATLVTEHDEVRVVAGDDEVVVPAPTHVVAHTDTSLLFSESRPVGLELQWMRGPAEEGEEGD